MHTYEKNEDMHSCGINGIAEKKGRGGYHFNRTVRVQWFFLVIFIWGFYVCASWFKGILNHWGWGVVDYAFNQGVGLGRMAGRVTGASVKLGSNTGPIFFVLHHNGPFSNHLERKKNKNSSTFAFVPAMSPLIIGTSGFWLQKVTVWICISIKKLV